MTRPSDAPSSPPADDATSPPGPTPAEQMARKLVRDVAAFEVDPPPPARAGNGTASGTPAGPTADADAHAPDAPGTPSRE